MVWRGRVLEVCQGQKWDFSFLTFSNLGMLLFGQITSRSGDEP